MPQHWLLKCLGTSALGSMLVVGCNHAPRQSVHAPRHGMAMLPTPAPKQEVVVKVQEVVKEAEPVVQATLPPAGPVEVKQVSHTEPKIESVKPRSFPDITAKQAFAHAPDYSWVTGELQYLHSRQAWRIRYASVDEEEKYGGSMTLIETGPMSNFHNGQLVKVEGQVTDPEGRESTFRVRNIQPLN